jgi:hypothetical protein
VRVVVLVLVLALGGFGACFYDHPKLEQAAFRCDEAHACPAGQRCIVDDKVCVDEHVGVAGIVVCRGRTCDVPDRCCDSADEMTVCLGAGADTGSCARVLACDGPEDCPSNQECCFDNAARAGTCAATCARFQRVCAKNADCDLAPPENRCCPDPLGLHKVCNSAFCSSGD